MRALPLALLGLLVAATPALAARSQDRSAAPQRAKVTAAAPAASSAAKGASLRGVVRPATAATTASRPPAASRSATAGRPAAASRSATAGRPTTAARGPTSAGKAASGRQQHAQVIRGGTMRGHMVVSRTRSAAIAMGPATASCSGRNARACRTPRMTWTQGLSPAAGVQAAECPAGTMATLATGHSNVTRCMPI